MRYWFWALWAIDAVVALGFGYFFLIGIADGSVSSFNIVLWLGILAGLAVVLGGGFILRATGHGILAICLLSVLAIPAVLSLIFFLFILISNPHWN